MNRPPQKSQRFVLASLLLAVVFTAMVAPSIIDFYTGAPRVQAPAAEGNRMPALSPEGTNTPHKGAALILNHPNPTSTPQPQSPRNCVLPLAYWGSHPDSWPSQGMTFGGLTLDKETALGVINSTAEDVQIIVLKELIVYSLNSLRGADPSPIIATVKELGTWLVAHGSAGSVPEQDRQRGLSLAASLEAFNQGEIGPGLCPETTDTPTPTITTTSPPTLSPTPSTTATNPPPTPRPQLFIPTATSRPNPPNPPPTQPPPPPATAAPTLPPPPPPTAAPTQPPPPTAVPTAFPTPTSPP